MRQLITLKPIKHVNPQKRGRTMQQIIKTIVRNIQVLVDDNSNPLEYLRAIDNAFLTGALSAHEYNQIQTAVRRLRKRG